MNQHILMQFIIAFVITLAVIITAKADTVQNLQGLTVKDAQYMDKHGYNYVTAEQFIKTCTILRKFYCVNGINWCSSGFLERRYLNWLSEKPELKQLLLEYKNTTCSDYKTGVKY